jgi:hypothetical protein
MSASSKIVIENDPSKIAKPPEDDDDDFNIISTIIQFTLLYIKSLTVLLFIRIPQTTINGANFFSEVQVLNNKSVTVNFDTLSLSQKRFIKSYGQYIPVSIFLVMLYFMNVLTPLPGLFVTTVMMSFAPTCIAKDKFDRDRDRYEKRTGLIYY